MLRAEKKFIDSVLKAARSLPKELLCQETGTLVRSLRKRLRMTQQQLAKRVKLPQSYIARIELGRISPSIKTLEKIFRGLHCSLTFLLLPEVEPDVVLEQQAYLAAQKKVKYVAGTMALEEQLPNKGVLQEMVEEEKKRLLDSETTKIWV